MYQRILVPTDATPLSKKAVTHALTLAAEQGAELVVLNVMPRYPTSYLEGAMVFEAEDVARVEKQWAEQARTLVNRVAEQAQARGIQARAVVVKSDLVAESIVSAATKHKADAPPIPPGFVTALTLAGRENDLYVFRAKDGNPVH